MAEQKRKRLAIIDGKSVFYRGYYAMPNLATKDGTPTGGVYGFAVMALEVIKRLKPDYVAVAWDKPKTNIRKRLELYPEYKAGRKPAPADFYTQIPILHELLDAFGWPLYELDDYEADDIMGTLAVQAKDKDIETMLVTSDLDMLQLINGHVHVYALKTGLSNIELYSPKSFEAKYGINVHQFLDLKALKGDSSDNIPGVPGIGEKGALELLKQYKTLDGVYENIELTKESTRKKLEAGKDLAYMSRKLASIWTDAPIKLDLKAVDGSKAKPQEIHNLLEKLQFRTLVRQLPEVMRFVDTSPIAPGSKPYAGAKGKNVLIDTNAKLKELKLPSTKQFFIHSRSAGKHGRGPQLLILSPDGQITYTLDLTKLNHKGIEQLLPAGTLLVGHDVKNTHKVLLELGVKELPPVRHDVLLGAFLLNSLRREQTLTELAQSELGYEGTSFEELDTEELTTYAPEIISVIRALYDQQAKDLQKTPKLAKVADDIDWPIIPVLARMEHTGIELNTQYLRDMAEQVNDIISDVEQEIYGHANQEFNVSSPAQLADILFDKLSLPTAGIKKGKTGYSTAASELDKLRGSHPIIDLITKYREVTKLKSTYVDTLPQQVDEHSRVHTTFNLTTAQTGRLSSIDPNLQNIPVRTDLGKRIRTAFVAGPERVLVSADYSQFELRLAAYLCGDKDLIHQFNEDIDVHTATAAEIYGREPEDVTKNMRREAKVVNFGVMYGLSPHGLVAATGMTYAAAKHFIDKYFEVRPKLLAYIESVKEHARKDGYVETLYGRRRPTPDVHSSNFMVREGAMRAAVNMPFQGTAADIMKLAMIEVDKKLQAFNSHNQTKQHSGLDVAQGSSEEKSKVYTEVQRTSTGAGDTAIRQRHSSMHGSAGQQGSAPRLLLQIHDSILVECIASQAERTAKILKDTMESVVKLPIKLTVDVSTGKNWGEL